jgi:hypothetical protein
MSVTRSELRSAIRAASAARVFDLSNTLIRDAKLDLCFICGRCKYGTIVWVYTSVGVY